MAQVDYPAILEEAWQRHLAPREPDAPTFISLFAGCGGSSLGYSMAGYRELLAVEWDDNAVATFKLNFPEVPVYHDDIHKLTVKRCLEMTDLQSGELDLLDGSPPCQGFSTAGKRQMTDKRNQLYMEFVRLLRGLKPKVFVMENVSGLIKGKMKLIFADIMRELKASGYEVRCKLLNAMYFNVPQSRQRLIWIGIRKELSNGISFPRAQERPMTVQEAISDLSDVQDKEFQHTWIDESLSGRNTVTWKLAHAAKQGEKYAGQQRRANYDKPFSTILKPSTDTMGIGPYLRNSHCHPLFTRTFSIRELARGSSFPDDFLFVDSGAAHVIGDSVPPLFMRAVALHVAGLLAQADGHVYQKNGVKACGQRSAALGSSA